MKKNRLLLLLVCLVFGLSGQVLAQTITVTPQEYDGGLTNPAKGFRPSFRDDNVPQWDERPYVTLVRHYIPWNAIENDASDGVEKIIQYCDQMWEGVEEANVKIIPRVILEYGYGNSFTDPSRAFWPADMNPGDYFSTDAQDRIRNMIAKLGEAWNDDPRVAWVQTGIYGNWGEQETTGDKILFSESQKNNFIPLLAAEYKSHLPNKRIVVRNPHEWFSRNIENTSTSIEGVGVYWDSFAHTGQYNGTSGSWPNTLVANDDPHNMYLHAPVEGEVAYDWGNTGLANYCQVSGTSEIGPERPTSTVATPQYYNFLINAIKQLHGSSSGWVSDYIHDASTEVGASLIQKAFGYRFEIDEFQVPQSTNPGATLNFTAKITNRGSAPIYESWPLAFTLIDESSREIVFQEEIPAVNIRDWLPGSDYGWDPKDNTMNTEEYLTPAVQQVVNGSVTIPSGFAAGEYLAGVTILDPSTDKPGVFFAVENFFKESQSQPLCRIGIGVNPSSTSLTGVTFDDPVWDDNRSYTTTIPGLQTTSVSIQEGDAITLKEGLSIRLNAYVAPYAAEDKSVSWSSLNPDIATVTSQGYVTAVSTGVAQIKVETNDNGNFDIINVTVVPYSPSGLNEITSFIAPDQVYQGQSFPASLSYEATQPVDIKVFFQLRDNPWTAYHIETNSLPAGHGTLNYVMNVSNQAAIANDLYKVAFVMYPQGNSNWGNRLDDEGVDRVDVIAGGTRVTGITFDCPSSAVSLGNYQQLTPVISPTDATNQFVSWHSSDPAVLSVDNTGQIHALTQGQATITVTSLDGQFTHACNIDVSPGTAPVTGVVFDVCPSDIVLNSTGNVAASVEPSDAINRNVTYESLNPEIATVDENGVITTHALGQATIRARSEGNTGIYEDCTFNVVVPQSNVVHSLVGPTQVTAGEVITVDIAYEAQENMEMEVILQWNTNPWTEYAYLRVPVEPGIRTQSFDLRVYPNLVLSRNYKIVGVLYSPSDGSWNSGLPQQVQDNVQPVAPVNPVQSIDITWPASNLQIGETILLEASTQPASANQYVFWKSDNESAVQVDANGLLTAVGAGSALITVKSGEDSTKLSSQQFTVSGGTATPTDVSIETCPGDIEVGNTFGLTAIVTPNDAALPNITYTSQDENIFTVSNTGVITGVSAGSAYVYLNADDGNGFTDQDQCLVTIVEPVITTNEITGITGPSLVNTGEEVTVSITYQATANQEMRIVFQYNTSNWDEFVDFRVPVAYGSRTEDFTFTIPTNLADLTRGYKIVGILYPAGETNWSPELPQMAIDPVTVQAAQTTESISLASFPTQVTSGESFTVSVDYVANETVDIVVVLQENGGDWTEYGNTRVNGLASGSSNVEIAVQAAAGIPTSQNYLKIAAILYPTGVSDYNSKIAESVELDITAVDPVTTNPVTGVSITNCPASMTVGDALTLTHAIEPVGADNVSSIVWSGGTLGIATINSSTGVISTEGAGSVTFTVTVTTTDNGTFTADCSFDVVAASNPVTGVSITNCPASMTVGDALTLTHAIEPVGADNVSSIVWSGGTLGIATINSSTGVISTEGAGSVTFTVTVTTTDNGTFTADCSFNVNAPSGGGCTGTDDLTWEPANIRIDGNVDPIFNYNSEIVNMACSSSATLSFNLSETGTLEPEDYCNIFYSVDGGTPQSIVEASGNFGNMGLITMPNIVGNSFQLIVDASLSSSERFDIQNIQLVSDGPISGGGNPVTSVSITNCPASMTVGEVLTLTESIEPVGADNVSSVVWSGGTSGIATINPTTGEITATGAGPVTFTVTVNTTDGGSFTANCGFDVNTVPQPVTGVSITNCPSSMTVGDVLTLTESIEPVGADNVSSVVWSGGTSGIATINPTTGEITATGAGPVTFTVTVNTTDGGSFTANCGFDVNTVPQPVTGVSITNCPSSMTVGDVLTLTESIEPVGADNVLSVVWSGGTSGIATINPTTGEITASGAGTVTFTVTVNTTDGGSFTANCGFDVNTVPQPVTSVSITNCPASMTVGDVLTLTESIEPVGADNVLSVVWSGGTSGIATINPTTGEITASGAGTVTFTVTVNTTDGGSFTANCGFDVNTVPQPVTGVSITNCPASMTVGDVLTLTESIEPVGADNVLSVVWSGGTSGIATINPTTGEITATGAGPVTFTVTVNTIDGGSFIANCGFDVNTVPQPVTGVSITNCPSSMTVGDVLTLTESIEPVGADNVSSVVWSGGTSGIATINPTTGEITASGAGTVTFTVTVNTTDGGSFTANCGFDVNSPSGSGCTGSDDLPWSIPNVKIKNADYTYSSGAIDMSCASSATLSMQPLEVGGMEADDFMSITYSIDGGATQVFFEAYDDFGNMGTMTVSGITGDSFELFINISNDANEIHEIRSISLTVDGSARIADEDLLVDVNTEIAVYPNPVSNILNIDLPDTDGQKMIKLIDATGRVLKHFTTDKNQSSIDVGALNISGMVFLQVIADDQVENFKVMIQK